MGLALGFAFYVLVQLVPARCLIPRSASLLPTGGHSLQHSNHTTWWPYCLSGLPVGVSSSAGASPYHANAAAALSVVHASTTFHDRETPRDIERLIPGQVCLRVEAVFPSRLRRRRTRTRDAAHPHHLVALVLHRCACLHLTPFVPEPAPTVR
jgi:hypothetical protein